MSAKSKLRKIENTTRAIERKKRADKKIVLFLEAHARGMVLCKDGVERAFDEWAKIRGIAGMLKEKIHEEENNQSLTR